MQCHEPVFENMTGQKMRRGFVPGGMLSITGVDITEQQTPEGDG